MRAGGRPRVGVGLYALAVFSTVFIVAALWVIESFEPKACKHFDLKIKAGKDTDALRPKIEAILRRYKLEFELRTSSDEEVCYDVQVPLELPTDRVSNAILKLDPEGHAAVEWAEKKTRTSSRSSTHVKLIIQPDDGLTPLLQAVDSAKKTIDIVIFRFDRPELEKALEAAVARGVVVRALIAHTNRGGEKSLRKLELRLLRGRRHRGAHRRRPAALSRQDDDRRRRAPRVRLQLHQARHREEPQLRHRHARPAAGEGGDRAVRGRLHAAALLACNHDRLVVSPETLARAADRVHQRREEAAADLRREGQRQPDAARARRTRAKAGVEIRIIGKIEKSVAGVEARKLPGLRLHVRAIVRDGSAAFVGSQSLRKLELDGRREVGVIVNDTRSRRRCRRSSRRTGRRRCEVRSSAARTAKARRRKPRRRRLPERNATAASAAR